MSLAEEYVEAHPSSSFEEYEDNSEAVYGLGWELISDEFVEEHRWYDVWEYNYQLPDGSYVQFLQNNPSTEMQEDQGYELRCFVVYAHVVTVTKFSRVP